MKWWEILLCVLGVIQTFGMVWGHSEITVAQVQNEGDSIGPWWWKLFLVVLWPIPCFLSKLNVQ